MALAVLALVSAGAQAQMNQPSQQSNQPSQQSAPKSSPGPISPPTQAPITSPNPPPPPAASTAKPTLQALDKNRDGSISKDEAATDPELAKMFGQLDRNRDGKLDSGEFANYATKK